MAPASAALMCRFFAHHGLKARIYIPDRLFEGYGPNPAAIEGLVKEGAQLIVTVDCGTTSREPLARAGELGCDVIVIDHHQADEELPRAVAVVNPNRQDDVSGLGHLCAAGVCFLVLVATRSELRRRGYYAERCRRARSDGRARPRRLGDHRRRGAAHRPQPRLRHAGAAGDALAAQQRPQGAERRGGAERGADAVSPGLHPRPAHQRRRPHRRCRAGLAPSGRRGRDGGGPHRGAARQAEQGAARAREGDARGGAGASRSDDRRASRYLGAAARLAHLAQGRRRPRRQPADRALPPSIVRHRLECRDRRRRHRLAALGDGRRHRRRGTRARSPPGISSRAAATPWRPV